jgi:hypothetical protein
MRQIKLVVIGTVEWSDKLTITLDYEICYTDYQKIEGHETAIFVRLL